MLRARSMPGVLAVVVFACGLLASASDASAGKRAPHYIRPPRLTLHVAAHNGRSSRSTFLTLRTTCGCVSRLSLDEFSRRDGRFVRSIGGMTGVHWFQVSPLDPVADSRVNVTLSTGIDCRETLDFTRWPYGCIPKPNTCNSYVEQFDPESGAVRTVYTAPRSLTVTDAVASPNGQQLAMVGGPCSVIGKSEVTVRDMRSGRQWSIGANTPRCTAFGPNIAWSPDGRAVLFPWAPIVGLPTGNNQICNDLHLAGLVLTPADRVSNRGSWEVIHADPRCGFLYGTFDARGIAAVEGCDYGGIPGGTGDPILGAAYLLQLSGPRHQVVQRIRLKIAFTGGALIEDPHTRSVLITESSPFGGIKYSHNWIWSYDGRHLRQIRKLGNTIPNAFTATPW